MTDAPARLTPDQIATGIEVSPLWQVEASGKGMARLFLFGNFLEAMAFMNAVAEVAEAQDHHPDWSNVYNRVHIRLTTHDAGGLTERDTRLAAAIDRVAQTYGARHG